MKLLIVALVTFCVIDFFPQKVGDAYALNINNIYLPLNSKGALAAVNVPPNGQGGQFGGNTFLFSGGFFLSGYSNGTLWSNAVASASLVEDYLPGTVQYPGFSNAQLYKIRSDDPPFGQSWQDWIDAVNLGADFYDGNHDGIYTPIDLNGNNQWDPDEDRPDLLGDETLWCVYHDGVPVSQRRWNTTIEVGVEVRQTVFAYENVDELQNIIFIRYRIRNTGMVSNELTDVYFGVWDDPDLGTATNDLVGCDTLLNGQYTYNWYSDPVYGNNPPSFFTRTLSGPITYIPGETFIDNNGNGIYDEGIDVPIDSGYVIRGQELGVTFYPGAKNLSISSTTTYGNGLVGLSDPIDKTEARNYMLGLNQIGQSPDPCTWTFGTVQGGVDCSQINPLYWYSGDRVNNYGWVNSTPTDQRQMQNIGPFTLNAGQEYEVFVAYNVGQGIDAFSSITEAKNISVTASVLFDSNFDTSAIVSVKEIFSGNLINDYSLSQNYPNPFNPTTILSFDILVQSSVTLKVYDMLGNEISTVVSEYKTAGSYQVEWDASGLPSGVYFYQLKSGAFIETKKMILMK